jgi:hypothetical protein
MGLLPDHFADHERLRVGLISDTHAPDTGRVVPPQAMSAFAGVDCIIHGGDIYELSILDQLEAVAPVYAARGNGDNGSSGRPRQPDDVRLRDTWVLRMAGCRVGVVHDLWEPRTSPGFRPVLGTYFGTSDLDVVVHGHTHVEQAVDRDGVLVVNPGSPGLPRHTNGVGTIGLLDIEAGVASASLWQITEAGVERIGGRASVDGSTGRAR